MREIDETNAGDYLIETGRVPRGARVAVRELAGGVSNIVLRVDVEGKAPMVLKQARERLRVAMEWLAPVERIWTEVEAMRVLADVLPTGAVPEVLFEDREEFLYAMTCAAGDAVTWKTRLMAGEADPSIAREVGTLLGRIHARAGGHPAMSGRLADASLFEALRVDPYYRTVARVEPQIAPAIERLIAEMRAAAADPAERTLVLGDYSPKNILVDGRDRVILLDFECAHAGDPAFDLGFFLSHLVLKAFRAVRLGTGGGSAAYVALAREFLRSYFKEAGIDPRGMRSCRASRHLAACLLARMDGKSPVEYRGELDGEAVRRLARDVMAADEAKGLEEILDRVSGLG